MQRLNRSNDVGQAIAGHHLIRSDMGSNGSAVNTPRLLVSVRDLDEALIAAAAGTQIIDVKNPQRGALGAADPAVWKAIAETLGGATLSAAMGEFEEALEIAEQVPPAFRFAKAGPVGASGVDALHAHWRSLRERLASSVELVAVAYADHEIANTLPAERIFGTAQQVGMKIWLLDTFSKSGKSSVELWGASRLSALLQFAKTHDAQIALAGSVTLPTAKWCVKQAILPAWFAVRGAVCESDRDSRLSPQNVARWSQWLSNLDCSSPAQSLAHSSTCGRSSSD